MNKEIAQLWTQTLRSNEYQQGVGKLRQQLLDGSLAYCCLGVLCDLYIKAHHWEKWKISNCPSIGIYELLGESNVLPRKVAVWAGMSRCDGGSESFALTVMNDNGATFGTIADFIDNHVDQL